MAIHQFFTANSIDSALALLAEHGDSAVLTAGSTDVMVALRAGNLSSKKTCLIDISRIPALSFIRKSGKWIEIGSGTTHALVSADPLVRSSSLILGEASHSVGSPQIRNRATIGGNIITAAQCADTIPALLALDAELVLRDTKGSERILPIRDFFPSAKKTAIRNDELLISIRYAPLDDSGWKGSYYKLIRRAAVAKSRLNFATLVRRSAKGIIEEARISIGSTIPAPGRFGPAEEVLVGNKPSAELVSAAAAACVDFIIKKAGKRWSSEYKEPVVRNVMRRELEKVLGLEGNHAE